MSRENTYEDDERVDWVETNEHGPIARGTDWKPGSRPHNRAQLEQKLEAAAPVFRQNAANWANMTADQKDAAGRHAQRAMANLLRYVRGIDSAGD